MATQGRARLNGVDPLVRERADWCLAVAEYYGVPVTVVSGRRSRAEQVTLRRNYEQCLAANLMGRDPRCRYPANKPGFSAHEYGLAWDATVPAQYESWWIAVRRYAGFTVLEGDAPHSEVPNWRDYVKLPPGLDD